MPPSLPHPASWRDPAGFVYTADGILYRQVNGKFREQFDHFMQSGCYRSLTEKGWLLPHEEVAPPQPAGADHYKTLKPLFLPVISYPYEWTAGMLREAALLTLQTAREALRHDCLLRDASPYNIQWHQGRMVFIDTLSFERYDPARPWIAYRQYCEQFLGPLLLAYYQRTSLPQLHAAWPDGIPLDLVSRGLPARSKFSLPVYLHIHLHARVSRKNRSATPGTVSFSRQKMERLLDSLLQITGRLQIPEPRGNWTGYYEEVKERGEYGTAKKTQIQNWLDRLPGLTRATDLGTNEGAYAKMLAGRGLQVLACDADTDCVENLYRCTGKEKLAGIHPLVADLVNPAPANGLMGRERSSFLLRARAELVLALALVHHLCLGRQVPLRQVVELLAAVCEKYLIVEFIPPEDEKAAGLLAQKSGWTHPYDRSVFETALSERFTILEQAGLDGTGRRLYLCQVP